jgi:hypothetical protein
MSRQDVENLVDETVTLFFLTIGPILGAIVAAVFVVALIYGIVTLLFR